MTDNQHSSAISFQALTTLREVEEIAPEWEALLQLSICNRAFSSPVWFIAACRHQPEASLEVIVARRGRSLAGVLPLLVHPPSRRAEIPTIWNDYNDMVAGRNDHEIMTGLLEHGLQETRDCDTIAFHRIRYDSNCLHAVRSLLPEQELKQLLIEDEYYYVPLFSSYEEYLGRLKKKFLGNLLVVKSKAQDKAFVRELLPSELSPERLPDVFLALHLARFGTKTPFTDSPDQAFLRYLLPRLFASGALRVFALLRQEEIVAINLCMVGPESLCGWNGGFLPEAQQWSPGTLLIDAAIHHACDAGLAEYDLMQGDEDYKKRWGTDVRAVGSIEIRTNRGRPAIISTGKREW
jgi:CelD/BcsL family acetyltransferase involved in cellulose biosynthesis